jgi:uncharacterized protein YjbI with pentapeptide repeats
MEERVMDANKLMGVLDKHSKWLRGDEGGRRANLSEANLARADLSGANLSEADLARANLSGANLAGAYLHEANLRGADLSEADLREANLRGANLRGADLSEANLTGAYLRKADLSEANIDSSCWPLWCGSKNVKVDVRIARQLAAHFCVLDCDDAEYQAARSAILEFAKGSHRAADLGLVDDDTDK